MEYVTISKWCQNWLREEYHPEAAYLPNGIDPSFYPKRGRDLQGKIRILIEGDCSAEHKNVDESFRIVEQLDLEKFEIWYMSYMEIRNPGTAWTAFYTGFHMKKHRKSMRRVISC